MEKTNKAISIKRTARIIASDNYDKKNIFIFFALNLIISTIITFAIPLKITTYQQIIENISSIITVSIIAIIGGFWVSGVALTSYNNAIKRQKGVVPNSFNNIGIYYLNGLMYGVGVTINILLITAITFIIAIPLSQLTTNYWLIFSVLLIPCLFLVMIFFGTIFNFYTTLKFTDLFNYSKAFKFMTDASELFWSIFWRSTALMVIFATGLIICSTVLGMFLAPMMLMGKMETAMQASNIIGSIFGCAIGCIFQIYLIELTAQFIRAVLKKQQNINIQEQ